MVAGDGHHGWLMVTTPSVTAPRAGPRRASSWASLPAHPGRGHRARSRVELCRTRGAGKAQPPPAGSPALAVTLAELDRRLARIKSSSPAATASSSQSTRPGHLSRTRAAHSRPDLGCCRSDRDCVHGPRHRQQSSQAQHGSLPGSPRGQTRHRRRPDRDRDPAVQEDGQAETAEKAPKSADGHRQHDALVRHRARPAHPAVGTIAAGVSVIVEAKLSSWQSYLALALFDDSRHILDLARRSTPGSAPSMRRSCLGPAAALDRRSYRPGPYRRVLDPRLLAGREQHLLPHHLAAAFRRSPPPARPLNTAASAMVIARPGGGRRRAGGTTGISAPGKTAMMTPLAAKVRRQANNALILCE